MDRVEEQASTPVRVAHSATAAHNMDGVGLRQLIAERVATLRSELALAAHLRL